MQQDFTAKRKRGRPSAAIAAQSEPQEERVSKRKRVEPSKPTAPEAAAEAALPKDAPFKQKKRGRQSNASNAEQTQGEEPNASRVMQKERANKSEKQQHAPDRRQDGEESRGSRGQQRVDYGQRRKYSGNQSEEVSQSTQQAKTRVDKSRPATDGIEEQRAEAASQGAQKKSRPGRPPKSSQAEGQEEEQPKSSSNQASKGKEKSKSKAVAQEEPVQLSRKRGRASLTNEDQIRSTRVEPTVNQQSKRRGRPSNDNSNNLENEANVPESGHLKKKRGRPSNADNEVTAPQKPDDQARTKKTKQRDENVTEEAPKRKKQRRSSPQPEERIEKHPPIAHQRLVPKEQKISRDIIDTKWNLLPPTAITRISTLLHEAERPVLHRFPSQSNRTLAQSAISVIIQRVERRLRKGFPFPPHSGSQNREEEFDLEKILRFNRALESQLTVLGHSNELLEADRRREEELFEREKRILKKMEEGAKEEERFNKAELRKSDHGLLKGLKHEEDGDGIGDLRLLEEKRVDLAKVCVPLSSITSMVKQIPNSTLLIVVIAPRRRGPSTRNQAITRSSREHAGKYGTNQGNQRCGYREQSCG